MSSHQFNPYPVTITSSLPTTPAIGLTDQVVGRVRIPAASTGMTTLTFYTSETLAGEFGLAVDVASGGTLALLPGQSSKLPYELVGTGFIKIVGNTGGAIVLSLKT
jgi:hypothetical protein